MKHEIKLTIEYDGLKVERAIPVGNLYKVDWKTVRCGLPATDECAYLLHDHITSSLMGENQKMPYEQQVPHYRKLKDMLLELCVKVKTKLETL